eukprot:GHUV01028246.1.p1 GENE.GHUV01028246.1~~GHUV01028246.1.p1  ORF type:complete len:104 (+),score=11.66 GHUV01028246.1:650-961(+)
MNTLTMCQFILAPIALALAAGRDGSHATHAEQSIADLQWEGGEQQQHTVQSTGRCQPSAIPGMLFTSTGQLLSLSPAAIAATSAWCLPHNPQTTAVPAVTGTA